MSDEMVKEIKSAIENQDYDVARKLLKYALKTPTAEIYYLAAEVALNEQQRESFLKKAQEIKSSNIKSDIKAHTKGSKIYQKPVDGGEKKIKPSMLDILSIIKLVIQLRCCLSPHWAGLYIIHVYLWQIRGNRPIFGGGLFIYDFNHWRVAFISCNSWRICRIQHSSVSYVASPSVCETLLGSVVEINA